MSKTKTAANKNAGEDKEKAKAKKADTKTVKAKTAAAKGEKADKPAKAKSKATAAKDKTVEAAEKAKAKKPAKSETDVVAPPTPANAMAEATPEPVEAKAPPPPAFTNAGLGIKTASKKPGLSVAPGVMILGRSAQTKAEQEQRPSDRRLSKKEQQEIKQFLLERRERLLAGMRRELAMQKERAETKAADEVDKATDAYDEDLSFEIATANDQELGEIQVALEKIERGTYGECEVCGCAISPSRLKILPSATTCVRCRGQEEQARRRDDTLPSFSVIANEDVDLDADTL